MNNTSSKNTLKINLVAPPSRGKTSISYLLAADLKLTYQADVEVVNEYAKEKCFMGIDLFKQSELEKMEELLEQNRREDIFKGKVDLLITSSPLMIVGFYLQKPEYVNLAKELTQKNCREVYFYLTKDSTYKYEVNGREIWTENKMDALEKDMIQYCKDHNIELVFLSGNPQERVNQMINKIRILTSQPIENTSEIKEIV